MTLSVSPSAAEFLVEGMFSLPAIADLLDALTYRLRFRVVPDIMPPSSAMRFSRFGSGLSIGFLIGLFCFFLRDSGSIGNYSSEIFSISAVIGLLHLGTLGGYGNLVNRSAIAF